MVFVCNNENVVRQMRIENENDEKRKKSTHTHPHTYTQWTNENYDKLENKRVFFLYEFAHDTDISTEQISGLAHSALAMYYICYWEDSNRQKKI